MPPLWQGAEPQSSTSNKKKLKPLTTRRGGDAGRHVRRAGEEDEGGGRGALTVLAGGAVPAVGADALVLTDFVDAGASVQAGGALAVVYV